MREPTKWLIAFDVWLALWVGFFLILRFGYPPDPDIPPDAFDIGPPFSWAGIILLVPITGIFGLCIVFRLCVAAIFTTARLWSAMKRRRRLEPLRYPTTESRVDQTGGKHAKSSPPSLGRLAILPMARIGECVPRCTAHEAPPPPPAPKQNGNGNGGGGDDVVLDLEPLLLALLKKIPAPEISWPAPQRVRWFRTFAMNVSQIFDGKSDPVELEPRPAKADLFS